MAQNYLSRSFYENHHRYEEGSITDRRFKHEDIVKLIDDLKSNQMFDIRVAGKSVEGRDIYLIKIGTGSTKVLAWSQMHGDESTATMALFDIFNFFRADDEFNEFKEDLLSKVTIYFVPMLNPDGAARFRRRNAVHIDLNRDALRLQFPESQTLRALQDSIKPEFGFNLHDQGTRYTAGERTYKSATISFLAPPFNYARDINRVRTKTMQVIVNMYDELSKFIPGHIGRYSDEYEPRAFGDGFVRWGTSSVLIESGGWKNDDEKQFIRRLNFVSLLSGFQSIANGWYNDVDIARYEAIPENDRYLFDLLLRNLTVEYGGKEYVIDIGIDFTEKNTKDYNDGYYVSEISDVGDLSIFYGYEELDCTGMNIEEGKVYPDEFTNMSEIVNLKLEELHENGYIAVVLKEGFEKEKYTRLPINIVSSADEIQTEIAYENEANFVITKNGKVKYVVINGFLKDVDTKKGNIKNSLIFH